MKKEVTIRTAGFFWKMFLAVDAWFSGVNKIIGFTTYWHTVIIREEHLHNRRLLAHELTHVKQIDDLGIFKFTWKYLRESWKNGYRNNKYEKEARAAESDPYATIDLFTIKYK